MDFFKNKIVKIVSWILWSVSTVVLILGGVTAEGLSSMLVAVLGVVSAVSAVVTLIATFVKDKE